MVQNSARRLCPALPTQAAQAGRGAGSGVRACLRAPVSALKHASPPAAPAARPPQVREMKEAAEEGGGGGGRAGGMEEEVEDFLASGGRRASLLPGLRWAACWALGCALGLAGARRGWRGLDGGRGWPVSLAGQGEAWQSKDVGEEAAMSRRHVSRPPGAAGVLAAAAGGAQRGGVLGGLVPHRQPAGLQVRCCACCVLCVLRMSAASACWAGQLQPEAARCSGAPPRGVAGAPGGRPWRALNPLLLRR